MAALELVDHDLFSCCCPSFSFRMPSGIVYVQQSFWFLPLCFRPPEFAKSLQNCAEPNFMHSLHSTGINVRLLGLVRSHVSHRGFVFGSDCMPLKFPLPRPSSLFGRANSTR